MESFPGAGPRCMPGTKPDTSKISVSDIQSESERLLIVAFAENTTDAYNNDFSCFESFRNIYCLPLLWPPTTEQLVMFVSCLSLKGLSHSTARLYVNAVGFQCKMRDVLDVSRNYIIEKALEGFKRSAGVRKSRLPITKDILQHILSVLPLVCANVYESHLFAAAYSLAFFGFLRVSEHAVTNTGSNFKVISKSDILIKEKEGTLELTIRYSKTDQYGAGVVQKINRADMKTICAVNNVLEFLNRRPSIEGPLFCHLNGKPLTRYQFSAILKKALGSSHLDYGKYTAHSFRIGAATSAAMAGCDVETIKRAGRWRSGAYRVYLKPENVWALPRLA